MTSTEYRTTPGTAPKLDTGHIVGMGAVFNKPSRNMGFIETVDKRAFDSSAKAGWPDVICRYLHSDDYLLGSTQGGTLNLQITNAGLCYDVIPPECRADVLELVKRGDVTASSFAFQVMDGGDEWTRDAKTGMAQRRLLGVNLVDVSPVIVGAYKEASAAVRDNGAVESLARRFSADPDEIRSLMGNGKLNMLFKASRNLDPAVLSILAKRRALELKAHGIGA